MKKLKQIFNDAKLQALHGENDMNELLWQLICYSPKMPVRLQQQQLLDEATKFTLNVSDDFFSNKELAFNGFKWGEGKRRILLTHGWGSKAADYSELITALRNLDDLEIISFDAPGNGSSEGELSNLLLFVKGVKKIIETYGTPDVIIGHSLGAMANVLALKESGVSPSIIVSLTPLIRLKENFIASMNAVGASKAAQDNFLASFESLFSMSAAYFELNKLYSFDEKQHHWLAYDKEDRVSPHAYIEEFLSNHSSIQSKNFNGVGHDKILKDSGVIAYIELLIKTL